MGDMHNADTYLRDRHKRWDNDTRGLLKEADRLLRKRRPAPPGYMRRLEQARMDEEGQRLEEDKKELEHTRRERLLEKEQGIAFEYEAEKGWDKEGGGNKA